MSGILPISWASVCDRVISRIRRSVYDISFNQKNESKILMFHDISSTKRDYAVNEAQFKKVIDKCLEEGFSFCSLDEMICEKKTKFNIVLTFDDTYSSVYEFVYPYLREKNIPFTIYMATENIGRSSYLTGEQIREMSTSGICTIGSHLHHHIMTRELTHKEIIAEVTESFNRLNQITPIVSRHIALPYGSITACSNRDISIVRKIGVDSIALTTQRNVSGRDLSNPFKLPRIDGASARFLDSIL